MTRRLTDDYLTAEKVGTFRVTSGRIVVADPCYDITTRCFVSGLMAEMNAKNGTWDAYIDYAPDGRIACLYAVNAEIPASSARGWKRTRWTGIGVDSGTMGIFDGNYHNEHHLGSLDDDWYDEKIVNANDDYAILDGQGVFSSSGYGDGSYPVEVMEEVNTNLVCAVQVTFIDPDYEDEEDDYYWNDGEHEYDDDDEDLE